MREKKWCVMHFCRGEGKKIARNLTKFRAIVFK
jgi:hypothetical protein